jgi:hypothetical protein
MFFALENNTRYLYNIGTVLYRYSIVVPHQSLTFQSTVQNQGQEVQSETHKNHRLQKQQSMQFYNVGILCTYTPYTFE